MKGTFIVVPYMYKTSLKKTVSEDTTVLVLTDFVPVKDAPTFQYAFCENNGTLDCMAKDKTGNLFLGWDWEERFPKKWIIHTARKYNLKHKFLEQ